METIQIVIVVIVGLGLLWAISWITKKSSRLDTSYYSRRWSHATKALDDGASGQKIAVMDADKLVDHALKARGFSGDSMGGRMRSAQGSLGSNYQKLWDAHKLRNRIAHEEVKLRNNEVRAAMNSFKQALKDLGAL